MKHWDTAWKTEPAAISAKRAKSVLEEREEPSAIFEEIDTAALRR